MKRVKSLVFNTFIFSLNANDKAIEFIAERLYNIPFDETIGYGFSNVVIDDNILSAKILKRTSTFIHDYDDETKEIIKKQVFIFSDIQFYIDFDYNILYVNGGLSQMNFIKSIFRSALDFQYELNQIDLSAFKFYNLLIEKNVEINIEQIIINRFNYNNGIVGRLNGQITDQSVGADLISEYKSDIIKISFSLTLEDNEELLIQVLPNGNIKFLTEENNFEYYLTYIKSLIFS